MEIQEQQQKPKRERTIANRCSKCNSSQTYIRLKDMSKICRSCGHSEKIKEGEDERSN